MWHLKGIVVVSSVFWLHCVSIIYSVNEFLTTGVREGGLNPAREVAGGGDRDVRQRDRSTLLFWAR